jgi:hypothetical protein
MVDSCPALILLTQVCKALQDKVHQRSVWHTALQDIWEAKPRAHQPVLSSLSVGELQQQAVFEARLEQRLNSSFEAKHLRTIDSMAAIISAQFIPNSGGHFISCSVGGELRLYSPEGEVTDTLDGLDPTLSSSHLWIRPVSRDTCVGIQLNRTNRFVTNSQPRYLTNYKADIKTLTIPGSYE